MVHAQEGVMEQLVRLAQLARHLEVMVVDLL
jgi:hypothetical protein